MYKMRRGEKAEGEMSVVVDGSYQKLFARTTVMLEGAYTVGL